MVTTQLHAGCIPICDDMRSRSDYHPYLLAVFLVGAYQEIMGNMHNLFGPVTTIDISLDGKGNFTFDKIHPGFTNVDSLEHVGFDEEKMLKSYTTYIGRSKLSKKEQTSLLKELQKTLEAHTYLQE